MKKFGYARASTNLDPLGMISESVRPKGGGMDLVDLAKRGVSTPDVMLDVSKIMRDIEEEVDGGARIGASVTLATLASDSYVAGACPALAEAAAEAATPQVRNVATLAGNLAQRPRCSYFRDPFFDCLKRGGETCPAMEGVHSEGAVFGNGTCCAVHPSNLAPVLMAVDAQVCLLTGKDEKGKAVPRMVKAADAFVRPEKDPLREFDVKPGELICEVVLPPAPTSAYVEVNYKQSFDWAAASCAVNLVMDGDKVKSARVVLGAVAPVPWRVEAAEAALAGKAPSEKTATAAAEAAAKGATPLRDNAHKVRLVRTVVKRAILKAAERSR
ncbi:MAG: FAD binding domain-containing protein [Planctomycetota bacterium]|jgi:xanthine dehydrogenase YagS FAD-binding subunit